MYPALAKARSVKAAVDAERARRAALAARKSDAENDLLEFVDMFWRVVEPVTPLVKGWVLSAMADALMAVTDGHLTRVILNVPPGSMKSMLLNVFWPAWEWGPMNMPHLRYLSASYSSAIPERDNARLLRVITDPVYLRCWGDRFGVIRAGMTLVENDKTGWKRVISTSSGTTGHRGDRILCLPADAVITTDAGDMRIEDIVHERRNVRIAGWSGSAVEWQAIEQYETNPAGVMVRIRHARGVLTCTADHRVWVEGRGYVAAGSIEPGEVLWCLPRVPDAAGETWRLLQSAMLGGSSARQGEGCNGSLPGVRDDVLPTAGAYEAGRDRGHMQPRLLAQAEHRNEQPCIPGRQDHDGLRVVPEAGGDQERAPGQVPGVLAFLRDEPDVEGIAAQVDDGQLPGVRDAVQAEHQSLSVLRPGVSSGEAQPGDDGRGQRPVCAWASGVTLSEGVDGDVPFCDPGQGWQHLSLVLHGSRGSWQGAVRPSHRLSEGQSGPGQPDHALPVLPWQDARQAEAAGGMARAVVSGVDRLGFDGRPTYNLRVGPHHNYFANGVLVHNCDDLNDPNDVESPSVRAATVHWVREVMPDRLNNMQQSAIINVQQRTHEQDATGILAEHGDNYTWISIPMEFDPLRLCRAALRWDEDGEVLQEWVDPRGVDADGKELAGLYEDERGNLKVTMGSPMAQAAGTLAWPERFPPDTVAALKKIKGPYAWEGQYNQHPTVRGGAIIQRDWWQTWAARHYPSVGTVMVSVDTAIKENEAADYTACTVWGAFADDGGAPQVMMLDAWRDRLSLAETVARVGDSCFRWKADYLLIEDKARGHDASVEIQRHYTNRTWETVLIKVNSNSGDKEARLRAVSHLFSGDVRRDPVSGIDVWVGGMVWAPATEWAEEVINEVTSFPRGVHDDYVDTVSQVMHFMRRHGVVLRKAEHEANEYEARKFRKTPGVPYAVGRQ